MDVQPALADLLVPVTVDELLLDVVEEVRVATRLVLVTTLEPEAGRNRVAVLGARDEALVEHRLEDEVAAFGRLVRVRKWVVLRGCLRQAGQERSLGQVEVGRGLVEEDLRRRLDTDRRTARVGAVRGSVEVL